MNFRAAIRIGQAKRFMTTYRGPGSASTSEVELFSRLAPKWWDEEGEFKMLHRMNHARMLFLRRRVLGLHQPRSSQFLEGKTVLDVGCGGGLFTEALCRAGAATTGIDAAATNVSMASMHASQDPVIRRQQALGKLTYHRGLAEDLATQGKTFDAVCAMEVLEHVASPSSFLRSLAALVKPGGQLVLSSINRTWLARILTIDMAELPLFGFVTPGTHNFNKYIRPEEIQAFFAKELGWPQDSSIDSQVHNLVYHPSSGTWTTLDEPQMICNYLFATRRPDEPI